MPVTPGAAYKAAGTWRLEECLCPEAVAGLSPAAFSQGKASPVHGWDQDTPARAEKVWKAGGSCFQQ